MSNFQAISNTAPRTPNAATLQRQLSRAIRFIREHARDVHLSALAMEYEYHANDAIDTAQINGMRVEVNPAFYDGLNGHERAAILAHEILHHQLRHNKRLGDLYSLNDAGRYSAMYSADVEVNNILNTVGFCLPADCVTVSTYSELLTNRLRELYTQGTITRPQHRALWGRLSDLCDDKTMTAELLSELMYEIFQLSQDKNKDGEDEKQNGNGNGGNGENGNGESESDSESGESGESGSQQSGSGKINPLNDTQQDSATWYKPDGEATRDNAKADNELAQVLIGCGKNELASRIVPAATGIRNLAAVLTDLCAEVEAEHCTVEFSRRPSRRRLSIGEVLPGTRAMQSGHVVIGIDTSGSMPTDTVDRVARALSSASLQVTVTLATFDTVINTAREFGPECNLDSRGMVFGNGGTKFQCVSKLARSKSADMVIIITDYGSYVADLNTIGGCEHILVGLIDVVQKEYTETQKTAWERAGYRCINVYTN